MRPPVRSEHPVSRLARVPFLGREALLEGLRGGLAQVRQGRGRGFLLIGEPGIGKTRSAEALARDASAQGFRVVSACCHETEGAPALWPWVQVVRELCAAVDVPALAELVGGPGSPLLQLVPELEARLGDGPVPEDRGGLVDTEARFALFDALASTLRRVARKAPLLIVLDDLHWADPASALLARFVLRETRDVPLAIVGTHREGEVLVEALAEALADLACEADAFRLEGFEERDVARLLAHVAGFEVADVLIGAVHAQTGGNPLFVIEVVRALASEQRLGGPEAPMSAPVPLPVTVAQVLRRRMRALSESTRELLVRAAVLGGEFPVDVLARCAERSRADVLAALEEAQEARLVHPSQTPGSLRFAHDLIRETLLAEVVGGERATLHHDAARALEALRSPRLAPHYAQLARHFLEAAPLGTASEAAGYALHAGREAARRFSFEEAALRFEQSKRALDLVAADALPAGDVERRRCETLLALGDAWWQAGRRERARGELRQAADVARKLGDAVFLARAAIALTGRTDLPMEFPAEAAEALEEALAALPAEHPLRVRVLVHLVRARYFGEGRDRLEAWAREAVRSAEAMDDAPALFGALSALHYVFLDPAGLEERLRISLRLLEIAQACGSRRFEAMARLWRMQDLLEVPDLNAADVELARFESLAAALRQPFYRWLATAFRSMRAQMEGRLDEAEARMHEAFELGRRADTPNAFTFFGTQLFHLREEQGRVAELEPVMRRIEEESPALPVFRIGLPLIHALCDRRAEARAAFEQVAARDFTDVPHDLHRLPMLSSAAVVAAYLGDTRRAALLLDELRQHAGRVILAGVGTYWAGPVDRLLGILEETLGSLDAAAGHLERARAVCDAAGARLLGAHVRCELARVLHRRGARADVARAADLREEAACTYQELGLGWQLERIDEAPTSGAQRAAPVDRFRFARVGRGWRLAYGGREVRLPDSKGMHYIRRLLETPHEEVHVLELVGRAAEARARRGGDTASRTGRRALVDVALDDRAVEAYRERLDSLRSELAEAEANQDAARAPRLREEIDLLTAELSSSLGLGGRPRPMNDPGERARKAVYNRIRSAVARIDAELPSLAAHLRSAVRTGVLCAYRPERVPEWIFEPGPGE